MTITSTSVTSQAPYGVLLNAPDPHHTAAGYQLTLAHSAEDVRAVQRLRYEVFTAEYGAATPGPDGLDADTFDDLCDHLIVWHTTETTRTAVATYRLLPPHANDATPLASGLYSWQEFDLRPLESLLHSTVEAGRSCVHPDHRTGSAISLLWGGIARYLHLTGYRYLIGCASVPLQDGGACAAAFGDQVRVKHLAAEEFRCRPRRPFDDDGIVRPPRPNVAPLLKGYLRLGAQICGEPALDAEFGTADFLVLLDLEKADQRYLRFFLGDTQASR